MELQLDLNKQYTFADYLTWFDDKRRELWNGFIKLMTPAPNLYHQKVSSRLHGLFFIHFFKNNPCQLFHAPFDVRFPENGETDPKKIKTVVQPDIVIVCDKNKLDKYGCIGAPDFIAEIISPSTAKRDMDDKFKLYEKHGVKEYWIVFPFDQIIQSFILKDKKFVKNGIYVRKDKIQVHILNNKVEIDLKDIFEDEE